MSHISDSSIYATHPYTQSDEAETKPSSSAFAVRAHSDGVTEVHVPVHGAGLEKGPRITGSGSSGVRGSGGGSGARTWAGEQVVLLTCIHARHMCVYVRTHTHGCVCKYTHIHTDTHIYTCYIMVKHIYTRHMYVCGYLHTHIFAHTHICTHTYLHTHVHVCVQIHTHTHGHIHACTPKF